jgi:hypothetical protein
MSANTRYKDSVFSFLFSDPDTLRELYGAIAGVELSPDIPVTVNTLEGVLYKTLLNDISFEVDKKLVVLIEHQSTINPNMAVRLLLYIARVYEKLTAGKNLYGRKKLVIPRPEFIVLYNGVEPYPDEAVLKLSETFEDPAALGIAKDRPFELELTVKVYNINKGHNEAIIRRCEKLGGYSAFIAKVREIEAERAGGKVRQKLTEEGKKEAMTLAVRWCIAHNILKLFLETHGSEVINMLYDEWKLEDALVVEREEGREEGLEEGLERGLEEGLEKGLEEGEERKQKEIAKNALTEGLPVEVIQKITGLDSEAIKQLSLQ